MSYSFLLGPLADQSGLLHMGDRFRGGGKVVDVEQLATYALVFSVLALVLWLVTVGNNMFLRFRRTSTHMLFWELCREHGIGWKMRWKLWVLAMSARMDHPAQLFVDPQLTSSQALSTWTDRERRKIERIRQKLFS